MRIPQGAPTSQQLNQRIKPRELETCLQCDLPASPNLRLPHLVQWPEGPLKHPSMGSRPRHMTHHGGFLHYTIRTPATTLCDPPHATLPTNAVQDSSPFSSLHHTQFTADPMPRPPMVRPGERHAEPPLPSSCRPAYATHLTIQTSLPTIPPTRKIQIRPVDAQRYHIRPPHHQHGRSTRRRPENPNT